MLVSRLSGLFALLLALLAGTPAALADPGPAPAPREYRVLQKLHTDAVSTFLDAGAFQLGSKADVPEGLGTRLNPDALWFHVDDASKLTVPAGMDFLAPAGATVWVAPQSNPSGAQLWPGFSTESVPAGAIDGNQTTFKLVKLEGPGSLELFTTGGFGQVTRLWSSDENIDTFQVGRTHMHANWAFTQPGTYKLTVEGSAQRSGERVASTATYSFVVGPLPERVTPTATLTASKTALTLGESVTLTGTVAPGTADGYVEFRRGTTVLGHDRVESGSAELQVSDLPVGTHDVTAVFVPAVANLATGSTSAALPITVSDDSGLPFSITGVKPSYQPGEQLSARVVGATLKENEVFYWLLRYKGTTSEIVPQSTTESTYSQIVDALQDDAEISVQIYDTAARVARSQTPFVPIVIEHQGAQPTIKQVGSAHNPLLPGDTIEFELAGRTLAEGETLEWGFSTYAGYFGASFSTSTWPATYLTEDKTRVRVRSLYNPTAVGPYAPPLVVSVMKDGVRIARSEFTRVTVGPRELGVSGHRNLYREGGRVELDATLYPLREGAGDNFTYTWTYTKGGTTEIWGTEKQTSPTLTGPTLTKAQHHGGQLRLSVFNNGELAQRSASLPINVTDDLTSQILEFSALAGHYHQGDRVRLTLTAEPAPLPGETLRWEWKWPGTDWQPMPGVVDNVWQVTAEQALDGVEIRAVLTYADPTKAPAIAQTRVVHVDDHGAAPRQKVTVTGPTSVGVGERATLTAAVAPASVLDRYQWYVKRPGSAERTPIAGAINATYAFTADLADDGSEYSVAVVKPDGSVAYGPSAPIALDVQAPTTVVEQPIGGTVGAVLALELGTPRSLGTFVPGRAQTYTITTTATVTSTLRDARLTVADPSPTVTGHLINGDSALATPLHIAADGGALAPLSAPVTLRTFPRAVAGEPVALAFQQSIGAREGLDVGSYGKTLTFTLTTSTP
ncbi:choice-of-anchor M domain-containing protein [Solirubrobacter sp. CPCC 204708]|uniref:Choice-of-anchor M domain-containing protein n=1 Tax=Solirubrobacter deserti TaxID=2282478 RepID=A0ABT4RQ13_9ACTN|nr:choice-of-anchor M domain-containing protein [Solirubrobacter deserti]MBE2316672.1 choice-of-anchor M domain-containing protein [Solirubrobacter deserti]MDA0140570.1 choice-of-anchor M domain-containing protein [Solirubrobacter deserti]